MPDPLAWPSVVDVLLFDTSGSDAHQTDRTDRIDRVQAEVLRNLNKLLNCRRRGRRSDPRLELVQESVYEYGIPDFTGAGFNTKSGREQLRRDILAAVRAFEPRILVKDVRDLNADQRLRRVLHYRIDASLLVYPRPQRVEYDSRFDCATQRFTVGES